MKNWFVENLGDRYKLLSGWQTVELIDKCLKERTVGLSTEQRRVLIDSFGDSGIRGNLNMPFIAYAWDEEEPTGKSWWRLTIPFFLVWVFVVFFFLQPFKWVITGKYYVSQDSKIGKFNIAWYNKIFDRRWSE